MSMLGVFQPLSSCIGTAELSEWECQPLSSQCSAMNMMRIGEMLCIRVPALGCAFNGRTVPHGAQSTRTSHEIPTTSRRKIKKKKKVHAGEPKQLRFSQFPTCVAAGQEVFGFFFPETVPAAIFRKPKMLFWYKMALVK